jgi:hypothetical protein
MSQQALLNAEELIFGSYIHKEEYKMRSLGRLCARHEPGNRNQSCCTKKHRRQLGSLYAGVAPSAPCAGGAASVARACACAYRIAVY